MSRALWIGLACAAAGVAVGARASAVAAAKPSAAPAPVAVHAPERAETEAPAAAHFDEADRAALRAIVREELAAARVADKPAPDRTEPEAAPREVAPATPRAIRAFDQARATIDEGVSRGRWSLADRERVRGDLAQLPTETRIELERPLVVAVNEKRVRFEGHGPLF